MADMLRLNVDMKSSPGMSIGAAAARFGLAPHVLRHWEAEGLLAPARAAGDRRRYGTGDLYRIAMIVRAKGAGLGLEEIRAMFATAAPAERREVLRRRRDELRRRIAEARAAIEIIECALDCDHEDFTRCAHVQSVIGARTGPPAPPAPPRPAPRPGAQMLGAHGPAGLP
ncbi:MerR family transcriptional regulator [Actinomadura rugatobispora]|uniref:MerR family transcriptional regulator n=1 Tax=Actinomadura rugatobispora TaxID=1994 RepID=A0ABW0ZNN0_9ACTN|nr:MerR family transcriptional regulator [Actinomadura rugatobispora]